MKQLNVKYLVGAAILVAFVAAIILPMGGLEWSAQADHYGEPHINPDERAALDANNIAHQWKTACNASFYLKTDGTMELWYYFGDGGTLIASWANPPGNNIDTYNPGGIKVQWTNQGTDDDGNNIWQVNITCRNGESTAFEVKQNTDGGRTLQPVGGES